MATRSTQHYQTLSTTNQFVFTCPIFDADTKMAACMALREAVWMGKHIEKRRGCQAAMRCGMCPAAAIVSKIIYSQAAVSDDYGATEPKKGRLRADILGRIANVIATESVITKFGLSDRELELIRSARPRIVEQMKTAPGATKTAAFVEPKARNTAAVKPTRRTATPKPIETKPDAITTAATTGDMAAALNAA
jgi:hypothetical protein